MSRLLRRKLRTRNPVLYYFRRIDAAYNYHVDEKVLRASLKIDNGTESPIQGSVFCFSRTGFLACSHGLESPCH